MIAPSKRKLRRAPYSPIRPHYPSFRDFRVAIREHQLFVNSSELGVRLLAEGVAAAGDSSDDYLKATHARLKIPGVDLDLKKSLRFAGAHYVVATFHVLEGFFSSLAREYRETKRIEEWKDRESGRQLSALDAILANLSDGGGRLPLPELEVVRYYTMVRHGIVHHVDQRKGELALERVLRAHADYLRVTYDRLDAPNGPSQLKYDDFQLLLLCGQRLAAALNDACELTPSDVLTMVTEDAAMMQLLARSRTGAARLLACSAALGSQFGIPEESLSTFSVDLADRVKAIPTHRDRRRERFRKLRA